jgi:FAD synthase
MKPTFEGVHARTLETHLIGRGGPGLTLGGLNEYGWPIRLQVTHWLRGQVKFDGLPALIEAINADCRRVAELTAGQTTGTEHAGKRS